MYKQHGRSFSFLSIILIAFFFIGGLPWRELKADAETHSEYNCSPLSIVYDQTSSWGTSTQAQYTVTNTSAEPVEGWKLELTFSSDVTITNLWNAQDVSDSTPPANSLLIGNEVYNGTVNPGETITFGMTVTGSEYAPVAPLSVHLINGSEPDITPEITPVPYNEEDPFTYAIFAGSPAADLTISGWKTNISGDIYTGRDFLYQGSELTVNGTARTVGTIQSSGWTTSIFAIEENAIPLEMPDWSETILNLANTMDQLDGSAFTSQQDIVANGYYYPDGNITINSSTFAGTTVIVSDGDITINADTLPGEGTLILYSRNGNITINSTEAVINGIVYAPSGRVALNGNNITVNGRIVANEFIFGGSTLTVTTAEEDLWFLDEDPDITPTSVPTITPEPTTEPTPSVEPTVTVTPVPTVTTVPTVTSEPTVTPIITIDPTPTITEAPTPTPIDEELDSDEDGIPDYLETELGTNPNDPDTDGDGLNDLLELMTGYDPTKVDTDDNGSPDGDEDLDEDGLSNIAELNLGTQFLSYDTDYDGISDGSEIFIYGTNPLSYDSDEDGICDGDEITLGKDPTGPSDASIRITQTVSKPIENAEEPTITSVDVTMDLANVIDLSLRVKDMYNVDVYSTGVAGRIGSPVSFECEESFDTATVVFRYDDTQLGETREEDLGVLWFDEEIGFYIMQDQAVVDTAANTITLELTHFSTYVVVDTVVWYQAWENIANTFNDYYSQHPEDVSSSREPMDITIIVDESYYYMNSADRREAYSVIEDIINNMRPQDSVAITYLQYNTYQIPNLHYRSDEEGKELYLATARQVLLGTVCDVLIFDGWRQKEPTLTRNAYNELRRGREEENNVTLFISSGLKPNLTESNYYSVIEGINYSLYSTRQISQMPDMFRQDCLSKGGTLYDRYNNTFLRDNGLTINSSTGSADLDGDGLYDYMELEGLVFSTNGERQERTTSISTEDLDEDGFADGYDTDGDSLSDGEELGRMYRIEVKYNEDGVLTDSITPKIFGADEEKIQICIPSNEGVFCVFAANSDPTIYDAENRIMSNIESISLGGGINTIAFCMTEIICKYLMYLSRDGGIIVHMMMNGFMEETRIGLMTIPLGLAEFMFLLKRQGVD